MDIFTDTRVVKLLLILRAASTTGTAFQPSARPLNYDNPKCERVARFGIDGFALAVPHLSGVARTQTHAYLGQLRD
jgi:hypothetical protein